jgi:hypothetical protein
MSGGNFPRNEACEAGRRSATYNNLCIPREQPPGNNARIHCIKAIGTDGTDDRLSPIIIRTCSYSYRTECRDSINIEGRVIRGCVHACADEDYCNGSMNQEASFILLSVAFGLITFKLFF